MAFKTAAFTAALLGFVLYSPAEAVVFFNLNVNGSGSFSIDGSPLFSDTGVLEPDPSSSIGTDVLTFAFPVGQGSSPGDITILNPFNKSIAGMVRFTDAAGDLIGTHDIDRIILYSTAMEGNPADTGLPGNPAVTNRRTEDANGFTHYVAGLNVYNIQLEKPVRLFRSRPRCRYLEVLLRD